MRAPNTIVFVDQLDSITLDDRIHGKGRRDYTGTIASNTTVPKYGLALICDVGPVSGEIIAIGTISQSGRASTWSKRYQVAEIEEIQPVPTSAVLDLVDNRRRSYLRDALQRTGPLTVGSSANLLLALESGWPDLGPLIRRRLRYSFPLPEFTARQTQLLAMERDSLGLSLELANMPRDILRDAEPLEQEAPFLEGLRDIHATEDMLLFHESHRFDGLLGQDHSSHAHAVEFRHPEAGRLTVMNANNTSVERRLGVDLVYYHHTGASYVLVQYKQMRRRQDGWVYYGDAQLTEELRRMRTLTITKLPRQPGEYRLESNPFYLKIVKKVDYLSRSKDLMRGMYLPLDLVDVLLNSSQYTTRTGNLRVGWTKDLQTVPRYLNNDRFTELFKAGWIGSCGVTTEEITEVIRVSLRRGRAVTLAIKEDAI